MPENVVKPTLPSGMTAADLLFSAMTEAMVGDKGYFGVGKYSSADISSKYLNQTTLAAEISAQLTDIGELAEKPSTAESTPAMLASRNYLTPGKRTNKVSIILAGLSNSKKDYLESAAFSGGTHTFVLVSHDNSRVVIYNGMRWVASWKGESDGLWTIELTTEFSGATTGRIMVLKVPAA